MSEPLDLFGKPIQVGDYIAYPTTSGRSAMMSVYKVLGFTQGEDRWNGKPTFTLQAEQCETMKWSPNTQKSYLRFPEKAVNLGKCLDWYRPDEQRLGRAKA